MVMLVVLIFQDPEIWRGCYGLSPANRMPLPAGDFSLRIVGNAKTTGEVNNKTSMDVTFPASTQRLAALERVARHTWKIRGSTLRQGFDPSRRVINQAFWELKNDNG